MSRVLRVVLLTGIIAEAICAQPLRVREWVYRRFHPDIVELHEVQGLAERTTDGKLHLDVKTYIELVLKNSTEVNLARLDVYTAADQITAAKAPYDPSLVLGFTTLRAASPQYTQIGGAPTLSSLTQNTTFAYQQLLPTGQTVTAGFQAVRNSTNSAFNIFNPNISGLLNLQVTQPLLQNRSRIQVRAPLQIARAQLLITTKASEARIADLVSQAANQYWDAVRSRDSISVLRSAYELALKSYAHDKQALDLGALANLDIFQSETQVAERKRDLVQAEYTYRGVLDALRRPIGADLTPELRATELVLDDDPSALPSMSSILPFEDALAAALRARPEADAVHRRVLVDDLNAEVARNSLLPKLDLVAQTQAAGLSGNQVPVTGPLGITRPGVSGGLGDALGQVFGYNYPSYGGGLQLTFPLRSSAARASLADALVNRTRDRYTERQVRQQITLDVRQALNSIALANATIEAAVKARDLARSNVEAEQQKFELGTITAFEMLDSQNRLANSQSALLNAYVTLQEAFVTYQRATWTLLDGFGVVVEAPRVR